MKNGNKNAFPCDGQYAGEARSNNDAGLTKREYFAAMAMQGLIAADGNLCASSETGSQLWTPSEIATRSVAYADALLAELDKTNQTDLTGSGK